jgi:uncharacterized membrane protein YraQ (UPF0718 family)
MKNVKFLLKRYLLFVLLVVSYGVILITAPDIGFTSVKLTWQNLLEMLSVVPPIFILLGLLDVWVPRELMIKLTGEGSGLRGVLLSFLLGSFAAGPLYAAFPVAGIMMKKGSKFSNIMVFIGAWSTTKIPLLLFEASSLGWTFMLLRFALNIPVIFILGWLIEKSLPAHELQTIYLRASESESKK